MSQSNRSFDRMIIPAPCDADWDSMIGNDRVRFCEHCNLHVTNVSALTRQEAVRLVAKSEGRLCLRFVKRSDGSVITRQLPQKVHQISRRVSRLAAGAFTATLSLTSAAAQTTNSQPRVTAVSAATVSPVDAGSTVSGVISDPQGAVVPGATVTLTSNDGSSFTFTTGDDGMYKFALLPAGAYVLRVDVSGFPTSTVEDIHLIGASDRALNIELKLPELIEEVTITADREVRVFSGGGAVAFVEPQNPLVKAAFHDDLDAVRQLAFAALDINARDNATHQTALEQAVENGNMEIVRVLLLAGASPASQEKSGRTALMYLRNSATSALVRELISAGAKVNDRDESGGTPLMFAASNGTYEVVKELLDGGAKIDFQDADGKTALMFAAANDDPEVTKLLIDAGSYVNAKDHDGKTALMVAVEEGDPGTVKLLISHNADVNAVDKGGMSAIMYVAETEDVESATALLNAGADLSLRDKNDKSALGHAKDSEEEKMIKLLVSRGAPE
ncbi:MAG TPA: ankyrin repeat domain-containing protein [Pyrinomonadaceae bacterium]|nr:ankyrin repeat domain-containing protein [Pyrinomonadaceae bacterium]